MLKKQNKIDLEEGTQATWGPFSSYWLTDNSVGVQRSSTINITSNIVLSLSLCKIWILIPAGFRSSLGFPVALSLLLWE